MHIMAWNLAVPRSHTHHLQFQALKYQWRIYERRVYVQKGDYKRLHLANDMADAVLTGETVGVSRDEVLRILRPDGKAIIGATVSIKPYPKGTGEWTHPYHGPDNNPQSPDLVARRN